MRLLLLPLDSGCVWCEWPMRRTNIDADFPMTTTTTAVRLCNVHWHDSIVHYRFFFLVSFLRSGNSWLHFTFCADFWEETKMPNKWMKTLHSEAVRQWATIVECHPAYSFCPLQCTIEWVLFERDSAATSIALTQFLLPCHHIFICTIHVDNGSGDGVSYNWKPTL